MSSPRSTAPRAHAPIALALALALPLVGCGVRRSTHEASAPVLERPPSRVVVIAPGTYFPDWPSLAMPGEREYDESRSIEARKELPPKGPEGQIPMRALAGKMR